jgi:hypothetical protein
VRTAETILDEILDHVRPNKGCAVVILERASKSANNPNWVASSGVMTSDQNTRFSTRVAALRRSDTLVDWENIVERDGEWRRVAKWFSEVEG